MTDMALYMTPVIRNTATRGHNITKKKKNITMGCSDLVGPFSTYSLWLFLTGGRPGDSMMSI